MREAMLGLVRSAPGFRALVLQRTANDHQQLRIAAASSSACLLLCAGGETNLTAVCVRGLKLARLSQIA